MFDYCADLVIIQLLTDLPAINHPQIQVVFFDRGNREPAISNPVFGQEFDFNNRVKVVFGDFIRPEDGGQFFVGGSGDFLQRRGICIIPFNHHLIRRNIVREFWIGDRNPGTFKTKVSIRALGDDGTGTPFGDGAIKNKGRDGFLGNTGLLAFRECHGVRVTRTLITNSVSDGIVIVGGSGHHVISHSMATGQSSTMSQRSYGQQFKFRPLKAGLSCHFYKLRAMNVNIAFSAQDRDGGSEDGDRFHESKLTVEECEAFNCYQSAMYNEGVEELVIINSHFWNDFPSRHALIKSRGNRRLFIFGGSFRGGVLRGGHYTKKKQSSRIHNAEIDGPNNGFQPVIDGFELVTNCHIRDRSLTAEQAIKARHVSNSTFNGVPIAW